MLALCMAAVVAACSSTHVEVLGTHQQECGERPSFVRGACAYSDAPAQSVIVHLDDGQQGDLIVVDVSYTVNSEVLTQVSDSNGTIYQPLHPLTYWAGNSEASRTYFGQLAGNGPFAVTALLDRPQLREHMDIFVQEYSGVSELDDAGVLTGTTTKPETRTVITKTPQELIFGFVAVHGTTDAGPGFSLRSRCLQDLSEDAVAGPAGPQIAEFVSDVSVSAWATTIAAFESPDCANAGQ
jgi:hypothetical protein